MRSLLTALCFFFAACTAGYGQGTDTFSVMQYNLLNYAASDNPSTYKNPRLQTIINYVNPDIFGANEIARGSQNAQNILDNVLGTAWEKGNYVNSINSSQTNMLFWKKSKFGLAFQESITSQVRDIIAFKLYYKDPSLATTHDTTFLTVIVAHLKAGSTAQDSTDRLTETDIVANYLNATAGTGGNYLFMGDLNVYSSNEACYSRLVNSSNALSKFYDPINRPGDWNGNSSFADIHSQSTRKVSLSDGGVTGGLDDRFDQILVSGPIHNNEKRIKCLNTTYHIVAQDGAHFNKGLLDNPVNTSVPSAVLQALYEMSDHLPVTTKFVVQKTSGTNSIAETEAYSSQFTVANPVENHNLQIGFTGQASHLPLQIGLYGLSGNSLFQASWNTASDTHFSAGIPGLSSGLYLLKITGLQGKGMLRKLVLVR